MWLLWRALFLFSIKFSPLLLSNEFYFKSQNQITNEEKSILLDWLCLFFSLVDGWAQSCVKIENVFFCAFLDSLHSSQVGWIVLYFFSLFPSNRIGPPSTMEKRRGLWSHTNWFWRKRKSRKSVWKWFNPSVEYFFGSHWLNWASE